MNNVSPLPEASPRFKDIQYRFAAHLRDPANQSAPEGIPDRRLAVYRELLYNNIEGFISSGFPVLREITADEPWHAMVRDFYAHHSARSPYFKEIPAEFLSYLENRPQSASQPPWLLELAHYEWVELDLDISTAEADAEDLDSDGDLLAETPVPTPLLRTLSYDYPVHQIAPGQIPEQPQSCFLAAYRNRAGEVGFIEANPVTLHLLRLLEQGWSASGQALLEHIAAELQHPNPQAVVDGGLQILRDLANRDIILGTRRLTAIQPPNPFSLKEPQA